MPEIEFQKLKKTRISSTDKKRFDRKVKLLENEGWVVQKIWKAEVSHFATLTREKR